MSPEVTSLSFNSGKELSLGQEKLLSSDGLTEVFKVARRDFFNALVAERPNIDSARIALCERVSYLQARIKQREATAAYSSEQNYTMANRTFNDTLAQLLKADAENEDREKFQQDFMSMVADAVKYATRDLDVDTQKNVMFLLSKRMEEVLNG